MDDTNGCRRLTRFLWFGILTNCRLALAFSSGLVSLRLSAAIWAFKFYLHFFGFKQTATAALSCEVPFLHRIRGWANASTRARVKDDWFNTSAVSGFQVDRFRLNRLTFSVGCCKKVVNIENQIYFSCLVCRVDIII